MSAADDDVAWDDVTDPLEVFEGPDGRQTRKKKKLVARYCYTDADGSPVRYVGRTADKEFPQWVPGLPRVKWGVPEGTQQVPYHLPRLLSAVERGESIHVVDGEKDVLAIEAAGGYATCVPGGMDKWNAETVAYLKGAPRVVLCVDQDGGKGVKQAGKVARLLEARGIPCRPVRAKAGKDAADHLAAGHGLGDFVLADLTEEPPERPDASAAASGADGDLPEHLARVLDRLSGVHRRGNGWQGRCPAHEDREPSLGVSLGEGGRVLVLCRAGCETADVLAELDLGWEDLWSGGFAQKVAQKVNDLRVYETAREQLRDERARDEFAEPPSRLTLADELAIEDEPLTFTVAEFHPAGANSLLAARYKTGKTTLLLNLVRSLIDAEPFLGLYPVDAQEGRVAYWNYELSERQFRAWLRDFNVKTPQRGAVLTLRGHRMPLWTPVGQEWAVRWLAEREVRCWLVDPFARAYSGAGTSENDNFEVGRFLETIDVIKQRAGVRDVFMTAHTGRAEMSEGEEHARGATRLDDWADVRWLYTRQNGSTFLAAEGRDVSVPEVKLAYDHATRALSLVGGSRAEERTAAGVEEVVDQVGAQPGIVKGKLIEALSGDKNKRPEWIKQAIGQGFVRVETDGEGSRAAQHHYLTDEGEPMTKRRVSR